MAKTSVEEIRNIFQMHAKSLAGGYFFRCSSQGNMFHIICSLSDDYFHEDVKFDGYKMELLFDTDRQIFKLSVHNLGGGWKSPLFELTEPENIGKEMEGLLNYVAAQMDTKYVRMYDRKPGKAKHRIGWRFGKNRK